MLYGEIGGGFNEVARYRLVDRAHLCPDVNRKDRKNGGDVEEVDLNVGGSGKRQLGIKGVEGRVRIPPPPLVGGVTIFELLYG